MTQRFLTFGLLAMAACGGDAGPTTPGVDASCPPASLRVGEVRTFIGPSAVSCIGITGGSAAQEYLFVAANGRTVAGDIWSYQVGSGLARASSTTLGSLSNDEPHFRSAFEEQLRSRERRQLAERSLAALHRDAVRQQVTAARARVAPPALGDTLVYRVGDAASSNFCSSYASVRAVVKAIGTRAVIVQDVSAPPRGFGAEEYRAISAEFDTRIHPVDTQWFGQATDINADQRITILFTPAINRLSPPGPNFVGGFFFLSDLLPRSIPAQGWRCDASNEQEIIYLLTPDPDGTINGNRHSVPSAYESARGTLAHELQHMINQGVRQTVTRTDKLEVGWLNEGLSHFAEEAVGRAARGYADTRRLGWNDILVDLDDFDSFFRQNLIRLRAWMERPDLASPISPTVTTLAPRGAAWAMVRYAIDQYSAGDPKGFVRALVAGPEVDVANLVARARTPFDEILPGYLVANFGGVASSGAAARFAYASWDMRDAMVNLNGGVHPLRVLPLPSQMATQSPSGSGSFFSLALPAAASTASFRMRSSSGSPVDFSDARVFLLRVK